MRLALYQPDIPQNAGAMIRLAACLGVAVEIIEPCGFILDDRRLKRADMDYLEHAEDPAPRLLGAVPGAMRPPGRLVLLTTRGRARYTEFAFAADDILLLGRESAGVPDAGARRGRCAAAHPAAAGPALAQCGGRRGDGLGRGVAADGGIPAP